MLDIVWIWRMLLAWHPLHGCNGVDPTGNADSVFTDGSGYKDVMCIYVLCPSTASMSLPLPFS